ncbi:MAG: helix-turn-helix transcriptional regulator [Ferruginibacter sp.]|nr:helix-turn-helix transcriptional regulator [Ferruginibacter sp.]
MNFGKKLKDIRQSNNLSQEDMGEILFTTQGNISQYETNARKPSIDQIKILVERFNLDANWLLSNNEDQIVNFYDQSTCNIAALKTENYYSISSDKIADIENKLDLIISKL